MATSSRLMQQSENKRQKGQTNWPIMHFTLFSTLQQWQTLLLSQIPTAIAPDYCLTKRLKRRGTKQSRRANEAKPFPAPQYSRNLLCCGQDDRSAKFSTWNETPDDPLLMTREL